MAKHLIDTDLYIDLIQSGTTLPLIRELYEKEAPGIYFSSIVAQELLAGARSPAAANVSKHCLSHSKKPRA
jgi:predicted nucleic acid-binding protein